MARTEVATCEAVVETAATAADALEGVADPHWCIVHEDGHLVHRCPCGFEWHEEAPC